MSLTTRRALRVFAVSLAATSLVATLAPPAGAEEEFVITARLLQYSPSEASVETGTTVIFRNDEVFDYPAPVDGSHRVKAVDGSFDSGDLGPGQQFAMKVLEPGTFDFKCVVHPSLMTGTLEVTGDPIVEPLDLEVSIVEPSSSDTQSWGFDPDEALIAPGTTVTWRNNGGSEHTVTADDGTFDSGLLASGETFTYTFDKAIALRYKCTPHPWMTGLVQVKGAKPPPPVDKPRNEPPPAPQPQPDRTGDQPVTLTVQAVEPNLSDPNSWGFAPPQLSARVGDTVVFENAGSTIHTVTADDGSFDSGNLEAGDTFQIVLDQTGTFVYHCEPHPWMTGTIAVGAAGAPVPEQPVGNPEPVTPGNGGAPPPTTGEPPEVDGDPKAAARNASAYGIGGFILLLGVAFALTTMRDLRKGTPTPVETHTEQRQLVGV